MRAHVAPQLGLDESLHQIRVALPHQAAVVAPLRAVAHVRLEHRVGQRLRGSLASAPAAPRRSPSRSPPASRAARRRRQSTAAAPGPTSSAITAATSSGCRPANTCTTRPPVELPHSVMLRRPSARTSAFEIADVVLDQIAPLRIPARVAVPAQVHRDDVIAVGEVRRHVVEGARDAIDAVQQHERRRRGVAPVEVVDAEAADRDEAVLGLSRPCPALGPRAWRACKHAQADRRAEPAAQGECITDAVERRRYGPGRLIRGWRAL